MSGSVISIVLDLFFFFQAEDGIRDLTVTGVQTCALPISMVYPAAIVGVAIIVVSVLMVWVIPIFAKMFTDFGGTLPGPTVLVIGISDFMRSEERRVGKECRSRWSPYH